MSTPTPTLTPTQSPILTTAIHSHAGKLVWFPENIKGGARLRVVDGLHKRGLITADLEAPDLDTWKVTAAGYEALGQTPPEAPACDHSGASEVRLDEIDGGAPADEELDAAHAAQVKHDEKVHALETGVDANTDTEARVPAESKPRRTRENSKQATIIALLKRPEGATIPQLVEATGWQAHTVRGAFAGALKKKLGLTITSTKDAGKDRIYHIA